MEKNLGKIEKMGIGLVTPSAPAPALYPERFKRGTKYLENIGLNVIEGKYVLCKDGVSSASPIKRAEDINNMFNDNNVSLVMATIGGDYSAEVLPYLDWELISKNRKGMLGYSDITILLNAIGIKTKQVVFYGPTLMTEFAEYPVSPYKSEIAFLQAFNDENQLIVSPVNSLLAEGVDWALEPKERVVEYPVFQRTIRTGKTSGIVLGGCIESLERLRGTEYFPCFKDSILLIETVDDDFNEKKWRCFITDYINMGVFKDLSGIVIGQKLWNENEVDRLAEMFIEATKSTDIPILYGLPFGHISPIATIPFFTRAILDADLMTLTYTKPFVYEYNTR